MKNHIHKRLARCLRAGITASYIISLFVVSVFVKTSLVSAAVPPLTTPGCYVRDGGEYTLDDCPSDYTNEEQCVLLVPALPNSSGLYNEDFSLYRLDCNTGNQIETIFPNNDGVTVGEVGTGGEAGTKSGVGDPSKTFEARCTDEQLDQSNCDIIKYLVMAINLLSAVAGMSIIASIIIAGYQYMTAKDNSGQVEAARKRILWAMIALGIFVFMYSILNWVVPGGVI